MVREVDIPPPLLHYRAMAPEVAVILPIQDVAEGDTEAQEGLEAMIPVTPPVLVVPLTAPHQVLI